MAKLEIGHGVQDRKAALGSRRKVRRRRRANGIGLNIESELMLEIRLLSNKCLCCPLC